MQKEIKAYIWVRNLLGIPRNNSNDREGTQLSVFGIEVDTTTFTARLPLEKLGKAIKATTKFLAEPPVTFSEIQPLVGFLSFCLPADRKSVV